MRKQRRIETTEEVETMEETREMEETRHTETDAHRLAELEAEVAEMKRQDRLILEPFEEAEALHRAIRAYNAGQLRLGYARRDLKAARKEHDLCLKALAALLRDEDPRPKAIDKAEARLNTAIDALNLAKAKMVLAEEAAPPMPEVQKVEVTKIADVTPMHHLGQTRRLPWDPEGIPLALDQKPLPNKWMRKATKIAKKAGMVPATDQATLVDQLKSLAGK